jgi:hypothetical protein
MGVSYAERSDTTAIGPAGSLVSPAREIALVDVSANTLELGWHGLTTGDQVSFRVEAAGVLPAPLVAGTTYYANVVDEDHFNVAATPDGDPIVMTTTGTAPFSLVVAIGPLIDYFNEFFSRWADGKLVYHQVPLTSPYPSYVTYIVALRSWLHVQEKLGHITHAQVEAREQGAILDFMTQAKVPLRDSRATPSANTAIARDAGRAARHSRGILP